MVETSGFAFQPGQWHESLQNELAGVMTQLLSHHASEEPSRMLLQTEAPATRPTSTTLGFVTLSFGRGSCPKLRRLLDEPEAEVEVSSGGVAFQSYIPEAKDFHPTFPKHSEERAELINIIRQKALYSLIELLHDPINVSQAVTHGLVPSLNARCADTNACIREYAVIALGMIAESHLGLEEMCVSNSVKVLTEMMNDHDHATRCNVFLSLLKVCYTPKGVETVLRQQDAGGSDWTEAEDGGVP